MERDAWLVQRYEAVAQLAGKMLESAQHGQWEELVELELQRTTILADLSADAAKAAVPDSVAEPVASLIGAILQMDGETAALAQAWQDELKGLLGSLGAERRISQAYGP